MIPHWHRASRVKDTVTVIAWGHGHVHVSFSYAFCQCLSETCPEKNVVVVVHKRWLIKDSVKVEYTGSFHNHITSSKKRLLNKSWRYTLTLISLSCNYMIFIEKVVSPYGASPYCLFPGCIVTWAWSLAKGRLNDFWLAPPNKDIGKIGRTPI